MGELFHMTRKAVSVENQPSEPHTVQYGSGNGGGDDMLERIKKLEDKMASLAIDVAVIKSNYATSADVASVKVEVASVKAEVANAKSDLHSAMRLQALAIIGSVLAAVGTGVGLIIKMMPSMPH